MISVGDIEHVIFDMDGTLVDTDPIYEEGWRQAFRMYGVKIEDNIIEPWGGLSVEDSTAELTKLVGSREKALELRKIREEYFFESLNNGLVNMMPHALKLFNFLDEKGITINLATSTHGEKGLEILNKLQIRSYFKSVIFGNQVEQSKPSPEIYTKSMERLKSGVNNTLVVEDSVTGVQAAIGAELPVIMLPYRPLRTSEFNKSRRVLIQNSLQNVLNFLNK